MNATTIKAFGRTIERTNVWLSDLMKELDWEDHERAYHALRAVLHALRDRLSVQEATDLAAQLPMLVRGFYFEGWKPSGKPLRERSQEQFLAHIRDAFQNDILVDPEKIARAVFKVLVKHVTSGEIDDVKVNLPRKIRELWS
jgi:uncharacterized protein (DUF2267 family)